MATDSPQGVPITGEGRGSPHPPAVYRHVTEGDLLRVESHADSGRCQASGEVTDARMAHERGHGNVTVKFIPTGQLAPYMMEATWDPDGWGPLHLYKWAPDGPYSQDYAYRYRGAVTSVTKFIPPRPREGRAMADGGAVESVITSADGILGVLDVIKVLEPGDRVVVNDRVEPLTVTAVYDGKFGEGEEWSLYVDLDGPRGGVYGLSYSHGVSGGVPATLINKKQIFPARTEDVTTLALVGRDPEGVGIDG